MEENNIYKAIGKAVAEAVERKLGRKLSQEEAEDAIKYTTDREDWIDEFVLDAFAVEFIEEQMRATDD